MNDKRQPLIAGVVLIILSVIAFSTTRAVAEHDGLLKVYFLDVGQGDAILIEAPNGNQVLIDGGPDASVVQRLGSLLPFYDHTIDAVLVSHPHSDHIAGLIEVLKRYDVGAIVEARESYDSPTFRTWEKTASDEHAQQVETIAGTELTLAPDLTLKVLHPFKSEAGTSTKTPHDDVVVAMLQYKKTKILFTGDMEAKVEQELMRAHEDVDADVLKVGHHGSTTSTSPDFLAAVSPQTAVIEVGAHNMYHHPSPAVITRLANSGIPYYRTDTNGTVTLRSNGETFTFEPTTK